MKNLLRLLLSILLLLISKSAIDAQVLNDESYNIDVRTEQYYFGNITANFFRSFILGIRSDSDCDNTLLLTTTGGLANGLTNRFFHQYGAGNYSTPNPLTRILSATNETSSKIDFTVVSFNWAQNGISGFSRYQTQLGDKNPGRFTTLRDFTLEEGPNKWNSRWHNGIAIEGSITEAVDDVNSLRSVKLGVAWRYHVVVLER